MQNTEAWITNIAQSCKQAQRSLASCFILLGHYETVCLIIDFSMKKNWNQTFFLPLAT